MSMIVQCMLIINLNSDRYVQGTYFGMLLSKTADVYTVDFTSSLKQYGTNAAPYVKKVSSNSCFFIGG